ncbi:MAG TPA: carboxypeptidase M32 [Gaiellaceae bacterium]|jgi:carboxypeptidase Taq|nr:carboxypeptidase M32 [Gaiellaceae bacterium]
MTEDPKLDQLKELLGEVDDLRKASTVLFWDQRVQMPPGGAAARADAMATLGRLTHEKFVSKEIGALLDSLDENDYDYDSVEASLLRLTNRDYEKAVRVPAELTGEMRRASAIAVAAWGPAKDSSDYQALLPHLQKNLELRHRYVECFDPPDETYDVLLDDYEPLMRTAEVRAIFDELKRELRPLIEEIADAGEVESSFLHGSFDPDAQREFSMKVVHRFGFDDEKWRLDTTQHPFMCSPGADDIRITTNYRPHDLSSIFASMHEFGHGVYEAGVAPDLHRTPLASGVSLGVHESQSRTWENLVGRSRAFWRHWYPPLQQTFPQLSAVDEEAFYRGVNKVHPSLIRIDADEVTYNMHIILRFELEQELIEGRIDLRDLPAEWNARMDEYLGVEVPDDAHGVLQDVHWAGGSIGYFPTYSLGNVISVQIWERMKQDLPDIDEQIERGEFGELREWLRTHLYVLGRKYTPQETIERVTGSRIDPGPYVRYLRAKLAPQPA